MGLEGVELVLAIEDRFGIPVFDEEAQELRTVGDLHALLVRKLSGGESTYDPRACATAHAFYRVRRALIERGVPRSSIRPASVLDRVLPKLSRRSTFRELSRTLDWRMPALHQPRWARLLLAGTLTLTPAMFLGPTGVVLGLMIAGAGDIAMDRIAVDLPTSCRTVGDLTRSVTTLNHGAIAKELGDAWTADRLWTELTTLMARQFKLRQEQIKPELRLVDDLGIE